MKKGGSSHIAVYTGSFDPMTLGHYDVIKRASRLFGKLIVAIGEARGKEPLFPVAERLEIIRTTCAGLGQVEVTSFQGLAIEFAASMKAVALVRGIRSSADYAYEMQ